MIMITRITPVLCALMWVSIALASETKQACDKLAGEWDARFRAAGFGVVVAEPFVIAGNGPARELAAYRDRTILAAKRALEATYFDKHVDKPILILLFKDADSYEKLAKEWFGDDDVPHYGFYRHADRTMLMNISTGGGTLVHELVHALIAPDFPDVPDWFNEGFASLYEQCTIDGETITGLPNWRLPALQKAIREKKLRPLIEMMEDEDFRNDDRVGINYAHARYLMYYLQQAGKLKTFYTRFRDQHATDPTGVETLKAVIAPKSIEQFDKEWQAWVLKVRS
jgi:hypothetical protein